MVFLKAWKRVNQYKQVTQVLCQQAFYFIFTFFAFNYSVQRFLLRKPVYIRLKVKMQLAKDYFWPSIDLHLAVVSFITVIVCTPPLPFSAVGSWASYQIFKRGQGGGVERISIFREGLLRKRGWPFSGGLQFLYKKQTKIWNIKCQKNFINENVFLCHN